MKKHKTLKTILVISISAVLALVLGVFIYVYFLLDNINYKDLPKSDEELGITPMPTPSQVISDSNTATTITPSVTNVVLYGLDRRNPDDVSRSDTIMIASLDGKNRMIKVTSLMRDMYVPIPGNESNRINAAYSFGGAPLAIKTINSNFGLDIRDYVAVDFIGLEKMVDKVGGLEINVKDYEIPEIEGVTQPGLQILNGGQVVDYSRIRYVGDSDFERTQRQRYVLDTLYKKIKSQGITKLPGTVSELLPYVETSLSKTDIMKLVMEVAQYNAEGIEQLRLPADGHFKSKKIRGMYVLVPDIEANKKLLHQFIYEIGD